MSDNDKAGMDPANLDFRSPDYQPLPRPPQFGQHPVDQKVIDQGPKFGSASVRQPPQLVDRGGRK